VLRLGIERGSFRPKVMVATAAYNLPCFRNTVDPLLYTADMFTVSELFSTQAYPSFWIYEWIREVVCEFSDRRRYAVSARVV
jgi:hypothetical protein